MARSNNPRRDAHLRANTHRERALAARVEAWRSRRGEGVFLVDVETRQAFGPCDEAALGDLLAEAREVRTDEFLELHLGLHRMELAPLPHPHTDWDVLPE
jgi:hypothetical protein